MKLHLAKDFSLSLDAVTQTFAVLAKRGVGKTHNSSVMAEEMLKAGQQVVAIDPTGAWWGLRSGFPVVIFGGEHADVPIEDGAGELIAQTIVESGRSAVIDVSLFRKGQARRFLIDFLETLYRLNREPLHLFVDEADDVCPQKPMHDEARLVGALEDVVKRGRKKGIGCSLITQRPAALNKDVLTQCEILVSMRLSHPLDIKAIKEWVGVHADPDEAQTMIESLPSLPIGEAWFWSPGWGDFFQRVKVRKRETFDSSATPKPGEKVLKPKEMQEIDLEALGAQIKETVQRAKENDPAALKRRIRELEAGRPVAVAADDGAIARAVEQCRREVTGDLLRFVKERDAAIEQLQKRIERAARVLGIGEASEVAVTPVPTAAEYLAARRAPTVTKTHQPAPGRLSPPSGMTAPTFETSGVSQRILNALAELEQLGAQQPNREMVAFLAGYTNLASKGFVNALSTLSSTGSIRYPSSDTVALTDAGRVLANPPARPRTAAELQSRICEMLGGASSRILQPLIEAYPNALPRENVAARAGYGNLASKGFVNAISRLRTLGFVDYPDRNSVVAMPVLFLEAAR